MIRIFLAFFLSVTIQQHLFSQNFIRYHSLANQACKALEDGFSDQAYIFLTEAFSLSKYPIAADLLNMAKCYSQMNEPDSTERYIYLALDRNFKIGRTVRIHSLWFEPVLGTEKWKAVVQKTYELPLVESEMQEQILKLKKIDSVNRFPPNLVNKEYWNSVKERAIMKAPLLDSILLTVSDSQLIHPAFEEAFLNIIFFYDIDYWISRKEMYMKLIEKGFLTPDILSSVFIEEYFGKNNDFNYLSYSPRYSDYYDRYGVSFDHYMWSFRTFNNWKYDEKEQ
jgi:hypothetical protein